VTTDPISSTTNPRVKRVRALQSSRSDRDEVGCFVIEGPTLLHEALAAGAQLDEVYYSEPFASPPDHAALIRQAGEAGAHVLPVSADVMRHMADTRTPQGVLAVLPFVQTAIPEAPFFILILDSVRDPGNLGTIMRLAAGAAIPLILLTPGTVDMYNPKVVRSAMGAHFAVPAVAASWAEVEAQCRARPVFVADSAGGVPHFRADWIQPCALIVSDEAHGAGPEALRLASQHVTIPMPGKTESLNVAMATGILIYEMVRQRMEAGQQEGK
jgi:TrmH family RNA methyltransferase